MDKGASIGAAAFVGGLVLLFFLWDRQPTEPARLADGDARAAIARIEAFERRLDEIERRLGRPSAAGDAELQNRILALELAMLERRYAEDDAAPSGERAPTEAARAAEGGLAAAAPGAEASAVGGDTPDDVKDEVLAAVEERIDAAVEKKAEQLQARFDKRPSLDKFSDVLELDAHQREMIDREVREGQWKIRDILETPTADGGVLLDELIEAMAYGQAGKPEAGAQFGKWWGRVMNERIPGTDQTYGSRIDALKDDVRAGFRRELSDEQYEAFESWQLDPTEIQGVTDGAWSDFEERVAARAAELRGQ